MNSAGTDIASQEQADSFHLNGELLGAAFRRAKWWIVGACLCTAVIGIGYLKLATPLYITDALLQIEDTKGSAGAFGMLAKTDSIASIFMPSGAIDTEMELIKSRRVLGAVVEKLNLDIIATPKYFPLIGAAIARKHKSSDGLAAPIWGINRYATGGEKIGLSLLKVPKVYEGKALLLVAGVSGQYQLFGPDRQLLLNGRVNVTEGSRRDSDLIISVSQLVARPGTEFLLTKVSRIDAINNLKRSLLVEERAKGSNIIHIQLGGANPEAMVNIVNAIAQIYQQQSVNDQSQLTEKKLAFVEAQLPLLKSNLTRVETAAVSFMNHNGHVNLTEEAKTYIDQQADVAKEKMALKLQGYDLQEKFGESNPAFEVFKEKQAALDAQSVILTERLQHLPDAILEEARLQRDVKVANELYILMLSKAQEFKVLKASNIGNAKIIDYAALPDKPVSPSPIAIVSVVGLLDLVMLTLLVLGYVRQFNKRSPATIEHMLGLSVLGRVSVAGSKPASMRDTEIQFASAWDIKDSPSLKVWRQLCIGLQYSLLEANKNIALVVSQDLATTAAATHQISQMLAELGKAVLIIDANIQQGLEGTCFSSPLQIGLTDVLDQRMLVEAAIYRKENRVAYLAAGAKVKNSTELLSSPLFSELLSQVSQQFDIVLVSAPPASISIDSLVIGRKAGLGLFLLHDVQVEDQGMGLLIRMCKGLGLKMEGLLVSEPARSKG